MPKRGDEKNIFENCWTCVGMKKFSVEKPKGSN